MKRVRTTVRLDQNLMETVKLMVVKEGLTQQELIENAVRDYLKRQAKKQVKSLVNLPVGDLGEKLDGLRREFYYR